MTAETLSIISSLATIAVLVVAGVVLRPYLTSYSQKKGEIRALHEDIEKILDQLRKTTATQEEIKAQISGSLWVQQGRWALRRDIYTKLLESLSDIEAENLVARDVLKEMSGGGSPERMGQLHGALIAQQTRMVEATAVLRRARALADVLLSQESRRALDQLEAEGERLNDKLNTASGVEVTQHAIDITRSIRAKLADGARTDLLGLDRS